MADITTEELEELENEVVSKDDNIKTMQEFVSPESLYQELIASVKKYHPSTDISLIEKAYKTADTAHKGQVRKSGEAYIIHPLCVAIILAELELDKETIVAGLLHDVVEDTVMTVEEIASEFSEEIALLVDGVTKLGQLSYDADKVEVQAENLRKMFLAMAKDIRVILIKLADRLHNMRTLKYMTPEKQKEKARETMDIYAPIAQRLGISKIKIELDDLSLKYLEPEAYYDLVEKVALRKSVRDDYVQSLVKEVSKHIENAGIKAQIDGRAKHFFSIYKKMVNQHKTLDQIYDLFAIRIIVDNVKDCYAALGVIHEMYKPIPGRFKDYIAMPKPNMYQSLHNTLIGPHGQVFEVQIRTVEMHKMAEYGVAAHWKYKQGLDKKGNEEAFAWIRQLLEAQQDTEAEDFIKNIKVDLFADEVFVFTPKGDVVNMPAGATPIDLAYAIHSAVGNRMTGCKLNGRIAPIDSQLKNGDIVEILTSKNAKGPSRDWMKIAKINEAKNKIKQWFKKEEKEENIIRGREMILADIKKKGYQPQDLLRPEWEEIVLVKYDFKTWDALLAAVGYGGMKEGQVVNRLKDEYLKEKRKTQTAEDALKDFEKTIDQKPVKKHKSKSGVVVEGIGDVAVRFSKCCSPVPGDEIIGFVTRGRGVTIHRTDCINVINLSNEERGRLINAEWDTQFAKGESNTSYLAELKVVANDRVGLIVEISRQLADDDISVKGFNVRTTKDMQAILNVTIEIKTKEQLERVVTRLKNLRDVTEVERVSGLG